VAKKGLTGLLDQLDVTETTHFIEAVARGEMLLSALEIKQWIELTPALKDHIRPLLSQGWKFARALRFATHEMGFTSTLQDLAGMAAYNGGVHAVKIGEFTFECRHIQ